MDLAKRRACEMKDSRVRSLELGAFGRTARAGIFGSGTYVVLSEAKLFESGMSVENLKDRRDEKEQQRIATISNVDLPKNRVR